MSKKSQKKQSRKLRRQLASKAQTQPGITRAQAELGGLVAEQETAIDRTYVRNEFLEEALDHESRKCFLIGRTGSGKSAILRMVKIQKSPSDVIDLSTDHFAFKQVELNRAVRVLVELGGSPSYIFKSIWKYLIVTAIVKHKYPDLRQRLGFFTRVMMGYTSPAKRKVYDFLCSNEEEYGDMDFAERLGTMMEKLTVSLEATFEAHDVSLGVGLPTIGSVSLAVGGHKSSGETKSAPASQMKGGLGKAITYTIERDWKIPLLEDAVKSLSEDVLGQSRYWLLFDDLDKAFSESSLGSDFIRCLFEVIVSLSHVSALRFLVALRTNIFQRVHFYQREKIEDYCLFLRWSELELRTMIEQRVRWAFGDPGMEAFDKTGVFPKSVRVGNRQIKTFRYMHERSLERPRDLIAFARTGLMRSVGREVVTSAVLTDEAVRVYSQGRLNALVDEWREEYPGLENVVNLFRGAGREMEFAQMRENFELLYVMLDELDGREMRVSDAQMLRQSLDFDIAKCGRGSRVESKVTKMLWQTGSIQMKARSGGAWEQWQPYGYTPSFRAESLSSKLFRVHPMLWAALEI